MKKLTVFLVVFMLLALITACGNQESAPQMGGSMDFEVSDFEIDAAEPIDTSDIGGSIDFVVPEIEIDTVEPIDTSDIGGSIDFETPEIEIDAVEPIDTSDSGGSIDFVAPKIEIGEATAIDTSGIGATIEFEPSKFEIPAFEPIDIANIGATIDFTPAIIDWDLDTAEAAEVANEISMALPEEDSIKLQELEPVEIEEIVNIQLNLLMDLQLAFEQVGMPVYINETTGEIVMDAAVLFGVDQSAVSPEGKQLLQQFMHVYSYVVFNEKYENYISKVIIEGHTDSTSTYEYNLKLSQERADQVLAYVLSDECGLPEAHRALLEESAQTIGYSYDRLILDDEGNEDMAASRRVCFRFLITLE